MVDMRVTDVARLGVLWRSGRSRADLIRGVVMLGSLAVATGGAIALARELPAWRGRQSVTEAARLIDAGDDASAIRTLLGAVAAAPRDARAHYYLGLAYARLGVPTGAMNQLRDAVRLAPGDARVHDALGQTLRVVGARRAARREFEEAARLDPGEARYHVDLAGLLLDAGQPAAAAERLRPAASGASAPAASPWVELARALKPAVVNISTKRVEEGWRPPESPFGQNDPFNQFFAPFFRGAPRRTVRSLGSGFAINSAGFVVTNNHVVDGATEIRLTLADGREFSAKVLGRDPKTDIALLKVEATGLPVIPLGDSTRLEIGEPVMAIGNPFGLEQTVTTGIVSATGRVIGEGPYDDFIQTDASINPGNSGGPLINAQGQAVGINAAIFSRSGGSVGIGFAIPTNLAKPVLTQLAAAGHVVRGYLGVTIQRVTADLAKSFGLPGAHGALVASVAERGGGGQSRGGRRRPAWRRELRARSEASEERRRARAGARAGQVRRPGALLHAQERRRPLHRRGVLSEPLVENALPPVRGQEG